MWLINIAEENMYDEVINSKTWKKNSGIQIYHINGLVQDSCNSIANILGLDIRTLKGFYTKTFSRMLGHDWLMLKHQPIITKHSAESFLLNAF